ncbi:MAG: hypothetical protein PHU36_07275 [Syntrophomonadaceae bacterium]|nr:hypothetical protein [Syntrophomonadaceae bacterium]
MEILIILAAVALLSWFITDKRFKMTNNNKIPPGYEKTEESFVDPTNKKRYRVYYNPADGARFYYEEP